MTHDPTENINIASFDAMPSPANIKSMVPLTDKAAETIFTGRRTIMDILDHKDPRLMVVVGPCSIHDPVAALDYAQRLRTLADEVADTLYIVMRVYFEKPRTTIGWKGFINDPYMDDSFRIDEGMLRGRKFLMHIAELGLPSASETLDPIAPQYYGDLLSWAAIGARTAESQTHREIASGLSTPVGFKNGTDGSLDAAVNGCLSSSHPHSFLGLSDTGESCIVRTHGNRYSHIVLRGGGGRPNYDTVSVSLAEQALTKAKLQQNIVVDCSHANSWKKPELQPLVLKDVVNQIRDGRQSIVGVMIESFIEAGNQPIPENLADLRYGCSVTDGCVSWDTTQEMLRNTREALRDVVRTRKA